MASRQKNRTKPGLKMGSFLTIGRKKTQRTLIIPPRACLSRLPVIGFHITGYQK